MRTPALAAYAAIIALALATPTVLATTGHGYSTLGFLPYWVIDTGYTPPRGLYSDVAFFDAPVGGDGSINDSHILEYRSYIHGLERSCGCRVWVTLTMFNSTLEDELLAHNISVLADNAYNLTVEYGFYGVIIDFEGINETNSITGENNSLLLEDLIALLHSKGLHVGVCIADYIDSVYRNPRIAELVDFAYLMAYDYHWQQSDTTGPVSPLPAVAASLAALTQYYPPNKIVVGLPLYGYDWPAQNCYPGAKTLAPGEPVTLAEIPVRYQGIVVHWDPVSGTPWLDYIDENGTCHQVWFDNTTSLAVKIDYAEQLGVKGFGYWALGYEDNTQVRDQIDSLTRSRASQPGIESATLTVRGDKLTLKLENATRIKLLTITITLQGAAPQQPLLQQLAGETPQATTLIEGNTLTTTIQASGNNPIAEITGTGPLLEAPLKGNPTAATLTIKAYYATVNPDKTITLHPATIATARIELKPPQPPLAGQLAPPTREHNTIPVLAGAAATAAIATLTTTLQARQNKNKKSTTRKRERAQP